MAGVEAIGLAVLGWVASPLVAKLLDEGFASLGINAGKKLEEMERNVLPVLKSVIEKAEGSEHRRKVEGWLQRLKDAYDGAEDALDRLNYDRLRRKAAAAAAAAASSGKKGTNPVKSSSFHIPKAVKWVIKGGRDMLSPRKMKLKRRLNKLEKIAGEAKELSTSLGAQPETADSRQTVSVPPPKVFGRDEDRDEIIRRLKIQPAAGVPIPIAAIVGRPGVGKTALAQYACEQLRSESGGGRHFHPVVWVHASRNFTAAGIMTDIIQQASIASEPQEDLGDPDDIAATFHTHLSNLDTMVVGNLNTSEALRLKMNEKLNAKKLLLVIDDVWCDAEGHKNNWDTLFRCLSKCGCLPGSKILVTSQTDDVPRKIAAAAAGAAAVESVYHLKDLAESDFSDLFIHHTLWEFDSHLREELKEKCKTIAAKLNRDPTTAKMVGKTIADKLTNLLRSQDYLFRPPDNLHDYLKTIADEDWSGDRTEALTWSYRHLPAHLQRCFSYCCLYPRGCKFKALELVQLWTAQGFIKPDDPNERVEDAGDGYLNDLVSRFYIQRHSRFRRSSGTGKLVCYYTLHELLYDLVEKVTRSDCVRIEGNRQSEIPSTIRHLCIPADKLNENKKSICKLKKLRTLIVTKGESVVPVKNVVTDIFKSLRKLRVLLVFGLNLEKLAKLKSEMKHLRILRVSGTGKFVLPESVSATYQLQVLEVEYVRSLPARLTNLVSLRNAIFRTPFLTLVTNEDLRMSQEEKTSVKQVMRKRMPKWFLQQDRESSVNNEQGLTVMTKRMETRSIFLYQGPLANNEKAMRNSKAAMNESSNEASSAEHNKCAPAADVDITAVWERWSELHERTMELIYSRQNEARLLLPSALTELSLEGCSITDRALSACLQTLTALTYLSLAEIRAVTCLPSADVLGNLTSLQEVTLRGCWAVTSLGGIGALPHLKNLLLIGCPCLDGETALLPSSLRSILFESCADVDVILANADMPCLSRLTITRCHTRTASLQLGNLRSLRSLSIEHCPGLTSLVDVQKLGSLEFLILQDCSNLLPVMKLPGLLKRTEICGCPIIEGRSVNVEPLSGGGIPVKTA